MYQQIHIARNYIQKIYCTCRDSIKKHSHFRDDKKAVKNMITIWPLCQTIQLISFPNKLYANISQDQQADDLGLTPH